VAEHKGLPGAAQVGRDDVAGAWPLVQHADADPAFPRNRWWARWYRTLHAARSLRASSNAWWSAAASRSASASSWSRSRAIGCPSRSRIQATSMKGGLLSGDAAWRFHLRCRAAVSRTVTVFHGNPARTQKGPQKAGLSCARVGRIRTRTLRLPPGP
jgi:hypothetical protein